MFNGGLYYIFYFTGFITFSYIEKGWFLISAMQKKIIHFAQTFLLNLMKEKFISIFFQMEFW